MSLPKIKESQDLTISDLQRETSSVRKSLLILRLKKSARQQIKPHLFIHLHHKLSQLLMLQSIKSKYK
uniref:50S ribosomal protein L29, chloroplastic n=1 Tax=Cyanidium caldarium TaxID=2771 RepID=Q9TLU0_CYACA|nr:ribosomal protein L29 [Cyanidium caldarium]AAF12915.1 unknown [Cyanidium caldarium]WDB00304.1 ribosomal protein L29 [Cyanidium caldarium]